MYKLERAMGVEPTTACLGSKNSTTELRPLNKIRIGILCTIEELVKDHQGNEGAAHDALAISTMANLRLPIFMENFCPGLK